MVGFDTKALILMPEVEELERYNQAHIVKLRIALTNLLDYLDSIFVEPHGIYTDELMHEVDYANRVDLYNLFNQKDTFYIYKNCVGMSGIASAKAWGNSTAQAKVAKNTDGLSTLERFDLINKTEKRLAQIFIKDYRIVFNFVFSGHTHYKVTSNPSDGKIRVYVDAATFVPKVYLSGEPIDACEILQIPYGNLPLTDWKK